MSKFPQDFVSNVSHWQATNRGLGALYNHGRNDPLPEEVVDIAIIGAGLSGSALAYHLTRHGVADDKKIVVLEGKDCASGATGRNGGHVAPYSFGRIPAFMKELSNSGSGLDINDVLDILRMEKRNLDLVTEIVAKEKLDVDFWRGTKLEVVETEKHKESMSKAYHSWVKALSERKDTPDWDWCEDVEEAKRVSRDKKAIAFSRGSAGSVHSHKFCTALLRMAIESGQCRYFSWCPVESFQKKGDLWEVYCHERGTVRAKNLVVCTNGYSRNLFPNHPIAAHLSPYRGHVAQVTPTTNYSGAGALRHTYVLERGPYLMQTPHAGIVLGVGFHVVLEDNAAKSEEVMGAIEDNHVPEGIKDWLRDYCKRTFIDWGDEAPGEGAQRYWSGVQCASADRLPLVGEVPGSPGLWVNMGHHGHGMGRITYITKCLGKNILTGQWDPALPKCLKITDERMKRAADAAAASKLGSGVDWSL